MTNKADQAYWNRQYADFNLHIAKPRDILRRWIERHVPPLQGASAECIEIGCYPGRYLAVFGELGYRLSGIDLADNLGALPRWLGARGYRVGDFWQQDFSTFAPQRRFDLVSSFGFIEHFTNWQQIIMQHAQLVADEGYLVIEAPNFAGAFQHWLHSRYDRANYARHHIPAMDIEAWARLLQDNGFSIDFAGCFGPFHFWTEADTRSLGERCMLRGLRTLKPLLRVLLPRDRRAYAPFCGVVARRHPS